MDRRSILKLLAAGVVGQTIDPLLWVRPRNRIFVPSKAQLDFINSPIPRNLYLGIPYHRCDSMSGQWMGLMRDMWKDEWKPIVVKKE